MITPSSWTMMTYPVLPRRTSSMSLVICASEMSMAVTPTTVEPSSTALAVEIMASLVVER